VQAFTEKLEEYAALHPEKDLVPFNKTRFTLELDRNGRWVHKLRYKGFSSVSDHFSFHLVDEFVGVKPTAKPVATPKRRRASDSGCDDSGADADANPYAFTNASRCCREAQASALVIARAWSAQASVCVIARAWSAGARSVTLNTPRVRCGAAGHTEMQPARFVPVRSMANQTGPGAPSR
jgi:hypothetical protein